MKLNLLTDFKNDEKGGILAFYLIMFITLMVGGGMAVDFMNSEYQREKVQDALDRGVLAAAAIGKASRAITPAEITAAETGAVLITKSYLASAGYDPEAPGVSIIPDFTINRQRMDATASYEVDTFFLKLAGIDSLSGRAAAGALVTQNDIEISLVLDISGSMGGTKIANLRTAGSDFVGNMLAGERVDYTFISVIPFNGAVNIGQDILAEFSNQKWHDYSGCVIFDDAAYNSTALDPNTGLRQVGHSAYGGRNRNCFASEAIVYSNNANELQTLISGLSADGWTSGFIGIKWAMALLDPSAQPIFEHINGPIADPLLKKPAAYGDENTLKFIIFMSDGEMNRGYNFDSWAYQHETDSSGNFLPADSVENANYWDAHSGSSIARSLSGSYGTVPLYSACTAARDAGIIVFTIAYGLTPGSSADTALQDGCASSDGLHFNVGVDDLDEAFAGIEASIQRLKLTN